jgi:hypothetical protein
VSTTCSTSDASLEGCGGGATTKGLRGKKSHENQEKLIELLRRAHEVIGEGLIENALNESAEGLHNEIAEVLALERMKRDNVRCGATWFVAGGRVERQCREDAVNVCSECGSARCDEHNDLYFEEHEGRLLCEECAPKGKVGR